MPDSGGDTGDADNTPGGGGPTGTTAADGAEDNAGDTGGGTAAADSGDTAPDEDDTGDATDGGSSSGAAEDSSGSDSGGEDEGESSGDSGGAAAVVFDTDVLPIIAENCGCHRSGSPSAGLQLTDAAAYDSLVDQPSGNGLAYVIPGDPNESYMAHKVQGHPNCRGRRRPNATPRRPEQRRRRNHRPVDHRRRAVSGGSLRHDDGQRR